MSFKIIKNNCCGLDVHKTWIFACIGITDSNNRTEYKQARFSSFTKGLNELCDWLAKYNCKDVCMESTGKYWIPVFNILEQHNLWVTLSHPKYTKPMKGNKTDRKDAKWICDLYMCGMVKPSFIPSADIRELRDLVRYRYKLTCMITGEKNRALTMVSEFSDVSRGNKGRFHHTAHIEVTNPFGIFTVGFVAFHRFCVFGMGQSNPKIVLL